GGPRGRSACGRPPGCGETRRRVRPRHRRRVRRDARGRRLKRRGDGVLGLDNFNGTTTRPSSAPARRCSTAPGSSSSRAISTMGRCSASCSTSCPSPMSCTLPPRLASGTRWLTRRPTCTPMSPGLSRCSRPPRPPTPNRPSSGPRRPPYTASTRVPFSEADRTDRPASSTPPPRRPERSPMSTTISTASPSPASGSSRSTAPGGGPTWPTSSSPVISSAGSPCLSSKAPTTPPSLVILLIDDI
ncbi:NAD dependent epimerase/dehydratase family, partial [Musa troglodytarum]